MPRKLHPLEKPRVDSAFMLLVGADGFVHGVGASYFLLSKDIFFFFLSFFFFLVSLSLRINNIRAFLKARHQALLGRTSS